MRRPRKIAYQIKSATRVGCVWFGMKEPEWWLKGGMGNWGETNCIPGCINDALDGSTSSVDEARASIGQAAGDAISAVTSAFGEVGGGCALH